MPTDIRVIAKQRNGRCDECAPPPRAITIATRAGYVSITVDDTEYLVDQWELMDAARNASLRIQDDEKATSSGPSESSTPPTHPAR